MKQNITSKIRSWLLLVSCIFCCVMAEGHKRDSLTTGDLEFIANLGQWEQQVLFKAPMHGGAFFAERDCFTIVVLSPQQLDAFYEARFDPDAKVSKWIDAAAYKVHFLNANDDVRIEGWEKKVGHYNYFIGKDTSKWKSEVPRYHEVKYNDLYLVSNSGSRYSITTCCALLNNFFL